jgi:dTDP-4-dehydrorhamnose 3,5-epimerase
MKLAPVEIEGLLLLELKVLGDARGFFVERFQQERFRELGLPTQFIQDNHSRSAPGVLRGLHYQSRPAQGKLVGVVRGRIWDVAVDVRPGSRTLGRHLAVELSDMNGRLLWIPPGFAHGFCVLGDEPADVLYKVDAPYYPAGEGGINFNDRDLNISWPIQNPTISKRDQSLPSFGDYTRRPPVWER